MASASNVTTFSVGGESDSMLNTLLVTLFKVKFFPWEWTSYLSLGVMLHQQHINYFYWPSDIQRLSVAVELVEFHYNDAAQDN